MNQSIDLLQAFSDLSKKEQMTAFFEIECDLGSSLHGLCLISRPINSSRNYLGMLLLVDTPSEGQWTAATGLIDRLNEKALRRRLRDLESLISSPAIHQGRAVLIRQFDIVFTKSMQLSDSYIEDEIVPALMSVTSPLQAGGVSFCKGEMEGTVPANPTRTWLEGHIPKPLMEFMGRLRHAKLT